MILATRDGLCECGCGRPTSISPRTHTAYGHVKGEPVRFIRGHSHRGKTMSAETRERMSRASRDQAGSKHHNWKGGRHFGRGYALVWVGREHAMADHRGYVRVHRLVMAARIGRMLRTGEVVHHVNEGRADNRANNLWLFPDRGAHIAWHEMLKRGGDLRVSMAAVRVT